MIENNQSNQNGSESVTDILTVLVNENETTNMSQVKTVFLLRRDQTCFNSYSIQQKHTPTKLTKIWKFAK